MQIFYLDTDPKISAQMLSDKHTCKMGIEATQILCTVLSQYGYSVPMKPTHHSHPCVKWTASSLSNYQWLMEHAFAIFQEYTNRYGRVHATEGKLKQILPNPAIPDVGFTTPPQAMPEEFQMDSVIQAYRNYYIQVKSKFAKWKLGNIPDWYLTPTQGNSNI